jgi:hypothetical protein
MSAKSSPERASTKAGKGRPKNSSGGLGGQKCDPEQVEGMQYLFDILREGGVEMLPPEVRARVDEILERRRSVLTLSMTRK